jgi:hypothetical protein
VRLKYAQALQAHRIPHSECVVQACAEYSVVFLPNNSSLQFDCMLTSSYNWPRTINAAIV